MNKAVDFSVVYKSEKLEATQMSWVSSWIFIAVTFRKKLYYWDPQKESHFHGKRAKEKTLSAI